MICIDSDVFLIDLRYPRDRRARATRSFLTFIGTSGDGATTVVNLLEIAGVLSFNLNAQQIVDFYAHFPGRYNVQILPAHDPRLRLPDLRVLDILQIMQRRASFGDALVAATVQRLQRGIEAFVTWNEAYFQGRVPVPVYSPETFPR